MRQTLAVVQNPLPRGVPRGYAHLPLHLRWGNICHLFKRLLRTGVPTLTILVRQSWTSSANCSLNMGTKGITTPPNGQRRLLRLPVFHPSSSLSSSNHTSFLLSHSRTGCLLLFIRRQLLPSLPTFLRPMLARVQRLINHLLFIRPLIISPLIRMVLQCLLPNLQQILGIRNSFLQIIHHTLNV